MTRQRIDVGILGATGVVGQQFVALLADHPWFRVTWLAASERSAGHRYGDLAWRLPTRLPAETAALRVSPLSAVDEAPSLVFSGLDSSVAGEAELAFAASGRHVVSNARNHRMDPLVPLLIPEVNPDHLALLDYQRRARGWTGSIVTNPNCATIVVAMVLGALRQFQPTRVMVTTLQALSGAGYPGVASLDAVGNVIPYIGGGEEEKIETRDAQAARRVRRRRGPQRRLPGQRADDPRAGAGRAHRGDVHRAGGGAVGRRRRGRARRRSPPSRRSAQLPTAPARPIILHTAQDRPQPRLDVAFGGGMPVHCGRVRRCPILGYKLIAMGHNVVRGAAGAALLNAELMVARGISVSADSAAAVTIPRR